MALIKALARQVSKCFVIARAKFEFNIRRDFLPLAFSTNAFIQSLGIKLQTIRRIIVSELKTARKIGCIVYKASFADSLCFDEQHD